MIKEKIEEFILTETVILINFARKQKWKLKRFPSISFLCIAISRQKDARRIQQLEPIKPFHRLKVIQNHVGKSRDYIYTGKGTGSRKSSVESKESWLKGAALVLNPRLTSSSTKKRGLALWLRHREKRCPNRKGVFDLENFNKATSVPFENEEIDDTVERPLSLWWFNPPSSSLFEDRSTLSLYIYIEFGIGGKDISEKFSTSIRELNRLKSWKLYSKHRGLEDNRIVPIRRARASYTKEPISISRGISDPSPPVQCMRQSNLLSLSGASILREAIPS